MRRVSILVILISFVLFGFMDITYRSFTEAQKSYLSVLKDNTMIVTKPTGFSFEDKQRLASIRGVERVRYSSQQLEDYQLIKNVNNQDVLIETMNVPQGAIRYFGYQLKSGVAIAEPDEIIISDRLAKYLVKHQYIDKVVLGQTLKLSQTYTIVGTFEDLDSSRIEIFEPTNQPEQFQLGEVAAYTVDYSSQKSNSLVVTNKLKTTLVTELANNLDQVAFITIENADDSIYLSQKIGNKIDNVEIVSNGSKLLNLSNIGNNIEASIKNMRVALRNSILNWQNSS